MKNRSDVLKIYALVFTGLALAGILIYFATDWLSPDVNFTIEYAEAQGLEPGQPLIYRGQRIGQVEAVDLQEDRVMVDVAMDADRADMIGPECTFKIEKPGGMMDFSGERQISVSPPWFGNITPIEEEQVVQGYDGILSSLQKRGKNMMPLVEEGFQYGRELLAKWRNEANEWMESEQAQQFFRSMETFLDDLRDTSAERLKEFREEELPLLRQKAEKLRQRLNELGKTEEAEAFWEEFTDWEEEKVDPAVDSAEEQADQAD